MIQKQEIISVDKYIKTPTIQRRIEELVGKGTKSKAFESAVIAIANKSSDMTKCTPQSIIGSAITAHTLNLPINQNLGFAYIVPYKGKAQFQMGYKGFIQLALRSGQFEKLNVSSLTESQFISYDEIKGDLIYDTENKTSSEPAYYVGYFKLINGFEKFLVMSIKEIEDHGKTYSKKYDYLWVKNFDAMARKTVIKLLLSRYAPLSLEMTEAVTKDQAVIDDQGNIQYVDNPQEKLVEEAEESTPDWDVIESEVSSLNVPE